MRVVLDEAQSIQNHRTQIARECWGLQVKQRWCLSGKPFQSYNNDLFIYFMFLKYDTYVVYKPFASKIKFSISRNPISWYEKLQVFLNILIILFTKGTTIDGAPIITLPPKKSPCRRLNSLGKKVILTTCSKLIHKLHSSSMLL